MYSLMTIIAITVAYLASAVLAKELARRKGRDEYVYFFIGLVLGPLSLPVVLTPLPSLARGKGVTLVKPLRVIRGPKCPRCRKSAPPRSYTCVYCGESLEVPWWDRPLIFGQ